jgi:hypothetical protein
MAPLTSDEMEEILVELVTGKPPRLKTPEAEEFRAVSREEIKEIEAKGGMVEIPGEFPE